MLVSQPHFAADLFPPATVLSLHSRQATSDQDLVDLIPAMAQLARDQVLVRSLVFTDGGAPSLGQRKRLFDALGEHSSRVRNAIVSDATSVRFVLSAMSLVVEGIRVFPPEQLGAALEYLGYNSAERAQCLARLRSTAKTLPAGRFLTFERALTVLDRGR